MNPSCQRRQWLPRFSIVGVLLLVSGVLPASPQPADVGRQIFLDTGLSSPAGVGCVTCHNPRTAFADARPVSPGAVPGRTGIRNAPSLMYSALIPSLDYEDLLIPGEGEVAVWEGGLFHDGRARDQFEQVQEPFFHPDEMNIADEATLAARLRRSRYASEFKSWTGESVWKHDAQLAYHAYRALVEFLKEPLFRPFDSRLDDYLAGRKDALNAAEKRGLEVYREGGKCADCHFLEPAPWGRAILSDFGYDNLGVPSRGRKDPGLGGHTRNPGELGMFRAPSLRNIALTAPYMHNGSLTSLQEVVEFYNKRDLEPQRWGRTDYPGTVNHEDLGDLGLTDQQVTDLVAFLESFTDRSLLRDAVRNRGLLPEAPAHTPGTASRQLHFPDWTHRLHPAHSSERNRMP